MAGFASRDRPAEGQLHDLWVKILALESADGHRGVVITSDLWHLGSLQCLQEAENAVRTGPFADQVHLLAHAQRAGTARCLQDYYAWDDAARDRVAQYTLALEKAIVKEKIASAARSSMSDATIWSHQRRTADFAVNRRNNDGSQIDKLLAGGEPLKGPVDHRVPLLAVRGSDGRLRAVVFGYACHTSMLALYEWSGDYAGFAQLALEEKHPDLQAMFYQACGGDQGAMPRRTVELTQKNGLKLAAAVERALAQPMRPVAPRLKTAFELVTLPFEKTITAELLRASSNIGLHYQRWAQRMLERLDAGETFPTSYPYAVQVWKLGADQLWISIGGEPVVDYSLKFAKLFGRTTWTNGFSHDLTAYIPSRRVWDEGGYEGGYLGEYGLPAMRWAGDVEDRITAGVQCLVDRVRE